MNESREKATRSWVLALASVASFMISLDLQVVSHRLFLTLSEVPCLTGKQRRFSKSSLAQAKNDAWCEEELWFGALE